MEIIKDDARKAKRMAEIRARMESDRGDEWHVGELCLCLNKAVLKRMNDYPIPDELLLLFFIGRAGQGFMTGSFEPEQTFVEDGLYLTPDWIIQWEEGYEDGMPAMVVGEAWEIKVTFQSVNHEISAHWLRQIMAYCKGLGINEFELSRLCMLGDWSWVYKGKNKKINEEHPILDTFVLKFTQEELDENWAWLKERQQICVRALDRGCLPSDLIDDYIEPSATFMCKKCECKQACPAPKEGKR